MITRKNTSLVATILALGLLAPPARAGALLDSYWPLNDGDYKVFVYGDKELTIEVSGYFSGEYEISMDSDDGSGSEWHSKTDGGDYLSMVESGWIDVSLEPEVLILDDNLLRGGGSRTTSTTVDQTGVEDYPATFTVKVSMAGSVTVPAGTFADCRNITVTEKAKVPGYGNVSVQAMTAVLAPRVGMIKKLVRPGVWASLQSGTVGGVDVRELAGGQTDTITVIIDGQGSVTPDLNGQSLQIGKSYTLTAKPALGHVFAGWSGDVESASPVLTFVMEEDMYVEASFIPNPFAALKGTYNGLIVDYGETPDGYGAFTLTVTDKGAYSMKLTLGGKPLTASGQLDGDASASRTLPLPGLGQATLGLWFEDSDAVGGELTIGDWTAYLSGDRPYFDGKTRIAPQAGQYTIVFPGDEQSASAPAGSGFGTLTVDKAGKLRFAGTLADGTKVTHASTVSRDDHWPFYLPLYAGKGCIISWLEFDSEDGGGISGDVTWIKPRLATSKYYPAGFYSELEALGSRYTPPAKGAKILDLTEAQLVLSGGNLAEPLVIPFTLDANNKVTAQGNQKLTLTFTPATGAFNGSAVNPATKKPIAFSGVVRQSEVAAEGFFLGADQSGLAVIRAR
jgi:hypothetical protein